MQRQLAIASDHATDVIEMGIPFTDPIADGPTIQKANTVSIYEIYCTIHTAGF